MNGPVNTYPYMFVFNKQTQNDFLNPLTKNAGKENSNINAISRFEQARQGYVNSYSRTYSYLQKGFNAKPSKNKNSNIVKVINPLNNFINKQLFIYNKLNSYLAPETDINQIIMGVKEAGWDEKITREDIEKMKAKIQDDVKRCDEQWEAMVRAEKYYERIWEEYRKLQMTLTSVKKKMNSVNFDRIIGTTKSAKNYQKTFQSILNDLIIYDQGIGVLEKEISELDYLLNSPLLKYLSTSSSQISGLNELYDYYNKNILRKNAKNFKIERNQKGVFVTLSETDNSKNQITEEIAQEIYNLIRGYNEAGEMYGEIKTTISNFISVVRKTEFTGKNPIRQKAMQILIRFLIKVETGKDWFDMSSAEQTELEEKIRVRNLDGHKNETTNLLKISTIREMNRVGALNFEGSGIEILDYAMAAQKGRALGPLLGQIISTSAEDIAPKTYEEIIQRNSSLINIIEAQRTDWRTRLQVVFELSDVSQQENDLKKIEKQLNKLAQDSKKNQKEIEKLNKIKEKIKIRKENRMKIPAQRVLDKIDSFVSMEAGKNGEIFTFAFTSKLYSLTGEHGLLYQEESPLFKGGASIEGSNSLNKKGQRPNHTLMHSVDILDANNGKNILFYLINRVKGSALGKTSKQLSEDELRNIAYELLPILSINQSNFENDLGRELNQFRSGASSKNTLYFLDISGERRLLFEVLQEMVGYLQTKIDQPTIYARAEITLPSKEDVLGKSFLESLFTNYYTGFNYADPAAAWQYVATTIMNQIGLNLYYHPYG